MVIIDSFSANQKEHIKVAYAYHDDYYTCGFDIEYSSIEDVVPKVEKVFHRFYNDKCELQAIYMFDGAFFMRRFNLRNETTYWLYWDATEANRLRRNPIFR